MKVLYVVYVNGGQVRHCVDAIRVLCNPNEKLPAHVTVRGPYRQRYNVKALQSKIVGKRVFVTGAGHFFDADQNTVFFTCEAPDLRLVWHKPEYDYNPHITLYDGSSRPFASALLGVLRQYRFKFSFVVDGLSSVVSRSGQRPLMQISFDMGLISSIVGQHIDESVIRFADEYKRLQLVDRICRYLSSFRSSAGHDSHPPTKPNVPLLATRL